MAAEPAQHAVIIDAGDGSCRHHSYRLSEILGPVEFGLRMQEQGDCLCIGTGALAGSIVPGSNRLFVTGHSPVWKGFYVSAMGGAGLVWDGVGISFLAMRGRASRPSVLVLRGRRGQRPRVRLVPIDLQAAWGAEPGDDEDEFGFYRLQSQVFGMWEGAGTPRVLATGPAAGSTRMGAIGSSRTSRGRLTAVDCWAGRGGFGSRMLQQHNVCAVLYGGDFEDDDLTDRAEADGYFQQRFSKKMLIEDLEATTKYRYDPHWKSGGTFGVNYAKLSDWMLSFNYRSTGWSRERRQEIWERLVRDHYLAQFNRETIEPRRFSNCGEPCPAVCKKLHDAYKKDYEPYQALGPLSGIFDQRAAERVCRHADALGFDAIQIGGQIAWLMECLHAGVVDRDRLGLAADVPARPVFEPDGFDPVGDSETNARLVLALLDLSARPGHPLAAGMRKAAAGLGPDARDRAVYLANAEEGWMVPNQYWVPGMFAPMSIMGKYYVDYHQEFRAPEELGRACARRMAAEVATDNSGMCRFHRGWSEELAPALINGHLGLSVDFGERHARLAREIHRQGRPVFWESRRIAGIMHGYLRQVRAASDDPGSAEWERRFDRDEQAAARDWWDELRKGIDAELGTA